MTFTLPSHLWAPQARAITAVIDALSRVNRVCLYSPTGSGKTEMAMQLMQWSDKVLARDAAFYINRKLLAGQTADRFEKNGLQYGMRAADFDDKFNEHAPFQICSADTERSRVLDKAIWPLHDCGLIVVDEGHLQKTKTMEEILKRHEANGAKVVLLTATPIGLSKWADELIVSGRLQEWRDCHALVPAVVKCIEQPDMSKVKRGASGEFIDDGKKRQAYCQTIVGNVLSNWKLFNPDARPALLYAPGVAESVWFTEQFQNIGVNWAHVDATDAVVDGKRAKLTRSLWKEIMERFKDGDIKGLSSRFKLREGVDAPFVYHEILATPIGSLASYIQVAGRVLRYSTETPDHVIIQDHGGNYWRHGSPNHDRPWDRWWDLPEHVVSELHQNSIKDQQKPESIVCPRCKTERTSGGRCPDPPYGCGFQHEKSKRMVIMEDGTLTEKDGHLVRPKRVLRKPDTESLWSKMFWGYRKKKVNASFAQMEAFFVREYGYYPPRDLPFMPTRQDDWHRKVHKVPMTGLSGREPAAT